MGARYDARFVGVGSYRVREIYVRGPRREPTGNNERKIGKAIRTSSRTGVYVLGGAVPDSCRWPAG